MDQSTGVMSMPFNVAATITAPMAPVDLLATDLASGLPNLAARSQTHTAANPPSTDAAPPQTTAPRPSHSAGGASAPAPRSPVGEPRCKRQRSTAAHGRPHGGSVRPHVSWQHDIITADVRAMFGAENALAGVGVGAGLVRHDVTDVGGSPAGQVDSPRSRAFHDAQLATISTDGAQPGHLQYLGDGDRGTNDPTRRRHGKHAVVFDDREISMDAAGSSMALRAKDMDALGPHVGQHSPPMMDPAAAGQDVAGGGGIGPQVWGAEGPIAVGYAVHAPMHMMQAAPQMPGGVGLVHGGGLRPAPPPSLINSDLWKTALHKHHQLQASLQEQLDLQRQLQDNLEAHKGYMREAVIGKHRDSAELTRSRSLTRTAAPEALTLPSALRRMGGDAVRPDGRMHAPLESVTADVAHGIDPLLERQLPSDELDAGADAVTAADDAGLHHWPDPGDLQDGKFDVCKFDDGKFDDDWADLLDFDGAGGLGDSPFGGLNDHG